MSTSTFLRDRLVAIAKGTYDRPVESLSELERVAVCYVAGVPIEVSRGETPERVTITTRAKCNIVREGGGFKVYCLG